MDLILCGPAWIKGRTRSASGDGGSGVNLRGEARVLGN